MSDEAGRDAVVVGAGISGLAAAWELARVAGGDRVVVLEASDRPGGRIRTDPFAGGPSIDAGADAFITRNPAAYHLCQELGLADQLVSPATGAASLWARGRLRSLPAGLVLGVPSDLRAVARSQVLGPLDLARAALDWVLPGRAVPAGEDVAAGEWVRRRLGAGLQLGLVDPLLGGIHAGRSEELSLATTAPALLDAARRHRRLLPAVRDVYRAQQTAAGVAGALPAFLAPRLGVESLVAALVEALAAQGVEFRFGGAATSLAAGQGGWRVGTEAGTLAAKAVIVAAPAKAAAGLLAEVVPAAARALGRIHTSDVTLVTLAFPESALGRPLVGSGFLVPRPEGRLMTACTYFSNKWPHAARPGQVIVRLSAGRSGDHRAFDLDDEALVDRLVAELGQAAGVRGGPSAVRVTRWVDAFPQYPAGHLQTMAAIESEVAARTGLAVAGAAYRGVGIPACIDTGRQAARAVAGVLQDA